MDERLHRVDGPDYDRYAGLQEARRGWVASIAGVVSGWHPGATIALGAAAGIFFTGRSALEMPLEPTPAKLTVTLCVIGSLLVIGVVALSSARRHAENTKKRAHAPPSP